MDRPAHHIFFSSHELSEVELICDRVAILVNGSEVQSGRLEEILRPLSSYRVNFRVPESPSEGLRDILANSVQDEERKGMHILSVKEGSRLPEVISTIMHNGGELLDIRADHSSLEDFFCQRITEPS